MTVPNCPTLKKSPSPIDIDFPGGGEIASMHTTLSKIPSPQEYLLNSLVQAGPGLAPFKPFFEILALTTALADCAQAVPKAIGSMNPGKVFDCIPDVIEKLDSVLKLIPQLSIPISAASMVDAGIEFFSVLVDLLVLLKDKYDELFQWESFAQRVADAALDQLIDCADTDLQAMQDNFRDAAAATGPLFVQVEQFLKEANLDIVIDFENPPVDLPLDDLIDAMKALVDFMREVRRLIPV